MFIYAFEIREFNEQTLDTEVAILIDGAIKLGRFQILRNTIGMRYVVVCIELATNSKSAQN